MSAAAEQRVMPDFARSFYGFHHTVDSALEILSQEGIPASRVTVRMAGLGAPDRWVVGQTPAPGTPLDGAVRVLLEVSGLGFFETLPVGMWHRGDEAAAGVDDILRPLDDPIQKAVHWVRQGARLFDIRKENQLACARWIRLFGLDPEAWPREHWHSLALLLPHFQRLGGGSEAGLRTALAVLLGLPLNRLQLRPGFRYLAETDRSRLGREAARLGVDMVVGDRLEDLAEIGVRIGPVSLETYAKYHQAEYHQGGRALLESVLRLTMSCYQSWRVDWVVLDPAKPPRLGVALDNSVLGLNTHLGPVAAAVQ